MTKLTASHLKPLAKAFREALIRGDVSFEEAVAFTNETYDHVLDWRVKTDNGRKRHPDRKD